MCGIACFAVVANTAPRLVPRFGAERLMLVGNAVLALGAFALLLYALAGGTSIAVIIAFTATVNSAFGLRGPPGFHAAIVAAEDDARGAALVVVAILCTASLSTAAVAPFISHGLVALGTGATVLGGAALAILWLGRPRAPSSVR
jgi:hypothetical protein